MENGLLKGTELGQADGDIGKIGWLAVKIGTDELLIVGKDV